MLAKPILPWLGCALIALSGGTLGACSSSSKHHGRPLDAGACEALGLRINEAASDNDGINVDEAGETDDWVELINAGSEPIDLGAFRISDGSEDALRLPHDTLAPGAAVLVWADEEPQGPYHAPFKLSASGDRVVLTHDECGEVDRLELPALPLNQSLARLPDATGTGVVCRYATPGRSNGDRCEPPAPPSLPDDATFRSFTWSPVLTHADGPLLISELALNPASFIELYNRGADPIALAGMSLRIAASGPGVGLPSAVEGLAIALPAQELAPGSRLLVQVDTSGLEPNEFEGVVTLFDAAGAPLDRVDFMRWPADAVLARVPDDSSHFTFCEGGSPGASNVTCRQLAAREVGDRTRHLRTPADFVKLAQGGTEVAQLGVKFVIDMAAGDTVHFLGTERWALHYTFIRERIYGDPPLDRCDPVQEHAFNQGWYTFSQSEYFRAEGRRFLLGTLVQHANGARTVEFAAGDEISPAQMQRALFAVATHTEDPTVWSLRPIDQSQLARMREIDGLAPIVGPNAPFQNVSYQPLTQTVGFGVLRFVPSDQLEQEPVPLHSLVITDAVPNDIAFVEGLITEAFQTPLAHVNVLSRARGTPNMGLAGARQHPRLAPLLDKLVRLEVGPSDFSIREASAEEAAAFWSARTSSSELVTPPRDLAPRGVLPLSEHGLTDVPAIGAKAAQFAELYRVSERPFGCPTDTVPLGVPAQAFAVPFAHYAEHFEQSGARALLESLLADPNFMALPDAHEAGLAALRDAIMRQPVEPALLTSVTEAVRERFGKQRVRFRSSSNTEDLPEFNGAGLHTSTSAELDDPELPVADAMRTVWASLWNTRAFDERAYANIDQSQVAMAILVHEASRSEAAQGVAVSRNLMHVTRADMYFVDAQIGEASVTNPAPGVVTEQTIYQWPPRTPELTRLSHSSLTERDVLSAQELRDVACGLKAVHQHFQPLLDPEQTNRLFAMQIEFKLEHATRRLVIKQARPQPFRGIDVPADCREFE
ncbi:MAG: PEP/pyruvate-binding domain-containing protein [Myxococcales bacterium]